MQVTAFTENTEANDGMIEPQTTHLLHDCMANRPGSVQTRCLAFVNNICGLNYCRGLHAPRVSVFKEACSLTIKRQKVATSYECDTRNMSGVSEDDEDDFQPRIFSNQSGARVEEIYAGVVRKTGHRITRNEETALRLVKEHTKVPVPDLISTNYTVKNGREHGSLLMELSEGSPLDSRWDGYDDGAKERICRDIWQVVHQLQRIPHPPALAHLYQCGADGSPAIDVPIQDLDDPPAPILTDEALRDRIYTRYLSYNGGSYPEHIPDLLPRSLTSVFTHGDLTPRNILVDGEGQITGVVDWEGAGWYPDYWEYANMTKPAKDLDWMKWMDRTKPVEWDITGINKARRVLF